jgi:hypothetical protein
MKPKTIAYYGISALTLGLPQTARHFYRTMGELSKAEYFRPLLSREAYRDTVGSVVTDILVTGTAIACQIGAWYQTLEWLVK